MVIYGIYNAETTEKLVNTLDKMHNKVTWHERLFVGRHLFIGLIGSFQKREQYIML